MKRESKGSGKQRGLKDSTKKEEEGSQEEAEEGGRQERRSNKNQRRKHEIKRKSRRSRSGVPRGSLGDRQQTGVRASVCVFLSEEEDRSVPLCWFLTGPLLADASVRLCSSFLLLFFCFSFSVLFRSGIFGTAYGMRIFSVLLG